MNNYDSNKGSRDLALHYMTTLVEVARESFLILDSDLRVVSANPTFYQNFKVAPEQTENVLLYELGNGQWNIPALRSLLEEILPKQKVVKDYEVKHLFETIGEKTILLNARQIDIDTVKMIVLAMEDISVRKELEEKLATTAKQLAVIAQGKEDVRQKLVVTAEGLAATAVEKEDARSKLAITAEGKEDVRRELALTAEKLAVTAKEKEEIRVRLETTAKALATIAREKESTKLELEITAEKLAAYTTRIEAKVAVGSSGEFAETNAKNEAILASIGDGLVVVDAGGNIIYINKSFEEMLGWKMQEVNGKSIVDVVPREDINGAQVQFKESILAKVLAGEKFMADLSNPFYFIRKDKTRFPVSIIVTPVTVDGKIIGAVETFRDITLDKEKGDMLADRVSDLEKLNKVMVGRELKMVELKKEIATLKGEPRSNIEREELKKK